LKKPGYKPLCLNNSWRSQPKILARLKPQPLIPGHRLLYQSNFKNACQCLTQLWKQTLLLPLGILPFPPQLLPQEKHLLTFHHRSKFTMVSVVTTSHSDPILSMAMATTPFTPSATGPPFSYDMPSSGTSPALTHSTLQTLGLGEGSSNAPLQGQLGGTSVPFNDFPDAGGHISPSSPSLGGLHQ
jgi:hypothetical protein